MGDTCGDNRFEIIAKAKTKLLESTNIHTSKYEMMFLDSFLFRCWQMGWLERYDKPRESLDIPTQSTDFIKENGLYCPDGYIFKDENGNVINATKIVLEKKKKEYPKTFEACVNVLGMTYHDIVEIRGDDIPKKYGNVLDCLYKLLICRDAYWEIAGDELGLGKPWKPDWQDDTTHKFIIHTIKDKILCGISLIKNHLLAFPTEEMRDAFKENFDPDIEICKEFL